MAELSNSGTYAKMTVHVWYDPKADSIHITSQDKNLPKGGILMTAKKGTQSDRNLREMLVDMGCIKGSEEVTKALDPEQTVPLSQVKEVVEQMLNERLG